ncbi:hypothetical protein AC249_AIPGENE18377 [Exaiptasia diaphana]|nr:hypothetical protein AC249_AIPGENE18377 [Exaiptasia diaphana]
MKMTLSFTRRLLTEEEQYLVNQRRYDQLVHKQRQIDHEIDAQLRNEEDKIRREEEALYEAKRQAARAAKQSRNYEENKKPSYQNNTQVNSKLSENTTLSSWTSDDGLSIDSAELDAEDFDSFLEKVKARSLNPSKQTGATTSTTAVSNGVIANGWDSFTNSVEPTKAVGKSSIDAFKILDLSPVESDDRATDVDR